MIALAVSIVLASAASAEEAPFQVLAGPAFEALASRTDAACPAAHVRFLKPADLDWEEETFEERLSAPDHAKFAAAIARTADGGPERCAGRDGLSCPASANLEAIQKAGQMHLFIAFVCATPPPG